MCMKFYDDTKLLYLKTDTSGFGLRAALLQLRDNTHGTRQQSPLLHRICKQKPSGHGAQA